MLHAAWTVLLVLASFARALKGLQIDHPCQEHNSRLTAWLHNGLGESGVRLVPDMATDLEGFVWEVKAGLDKNQLPNRPIEHLFSPASEFHPTCAGDWLEFGVASGATVNLAARFRRSNCSPNCPNVFGFDTFTGLPEHWVRDDAHTWYQHHFDQQSGDQERYPDHESNVYLMKGLFNESIPPWLYVQSVYAGAGSQLSYLHVDCDLYAGTKDILTMLGHKVRVGTVMVFDELINYQYFRDHEIKALWEWVSLTGIKLLPIGAKGPLPGKDYAVEADAAAMADDAMDWPHQSAAFVVAYVPPPRHSTH